MNHHWKLLYSLMIEIDSDDSSLGELSLEVVVLIDDGNEDSYEPIEIEEV